MAGGGRSDSMAGGKQSPRGRTAKHGAFSKDWHGLVWQTVWEGSSLHLGQDSAFAAAGRGDFCRFQTGLRPFSQKRFTINEFLELRFAEHHSKCSSSH